MGNEREGIESVLGVKGDWMSIGDGYGGYDSYER